MLVFTEQNRSSIEASDFVCLDAGSAVLFIPDIFVWNFRLNNRPPKRINKRLRLEKFHLRARGNILLFLAFEVSFILGMYLNSPVKIDLCLYCLLYFQFDTEIF